MLNSSGLYGNRLIDESTGPVLSRADCTQAFGQVARFDYPEYAFGFSLQIPLLNRSAQADTTVPGSRWHNRRPPLQQTRTGSIWKCEMRSRRWSSPGPRRSRRERPSSAREEPPGAAGETDGGPVDSLRGDPPAAGFDAGPVRGSASASQLCQGPRRTGSGDGENWAKEQGTNVRRRMDEAGRAVGHR